MTVEELFNKGFQARCDGRYAEAKTYFNQALSMAPGHADSRWQLGLIHGFEGDFDGSLAALKAVVTAHPQHVNARYDMAMTMSMLGMIDEACAEFREVLRLDPTHEKAKQQLAYCP